MITAAQAQILNTSWIFSQFEALVIYEVLGCLFLLSCGAYWLYQKVCK